MRPTLKDWFASRMQRLNMAVTAVLAVTVAYVSMLSAADLATIGLSEKQIIVGLLLIKIGVALANLYLRADTAAPLAGRSAKPDPMAGIQDAR